MTSSLCSALAAADFDDDDMAAGLISDWRLCILTITWRTPEPSWPGRAAARSEITLALEKVKVLRDLMYLCKVQMSGGEDLGRREIRAPNVWKRPAQQIF